ncbi:TetR/AcrR family transcriptional regulator C-terminal domain-containing protein [Tsukamurella tyrosinosolvens]|uniref:TetR/AcrR family transcriptional regulator C-terminal domain-containing protein n=1 Tax=Tsukamurella tyrosinosolvens TaxID=57704 RepID=UPI000C7F2F58|nr:GntR family transcriptional regulator [Tsukamurella tyrosinosolvens]AUN41865.1 GntR family transcriptional regulator [Tsukamurella tyrosinosolvens]
MPPPHPQPPYLVIGDEIRSRIVRGELRPGDRVPSIRSIAQRWGVAVATATKVIGVLRAEGLVETRVGSGTIISPHAQELATNNHQGDTATRSPGKEHERTQILRAAIDIANDDGIAALSMRRLAAKLGVGPMSLYRQFSSKEELIVAMVDEAFGELALPEVGPPGWRPKLELTARRQWRLCRRHHWLPRVVSFTRPVMAPNMMAHTEWTLAALEELDLPAELLLHETLTLHAFVVAIGLANADEADAERTTGVTGNRWFRWQQPRRDSLLTDNQFPHLAALADDAAPDLDALFEYSLSRYLDGLTPYHRPCPTNAAAAIS